MPVKTKPEMKRKFTDVILTDQLVPYESPREVIWLHYAK